ncbi:MAG TPA: phosphatase PAP2 family protein [Thiolinea sp.]|nr:phosphatase PAP2 family protein [Thiolinea sp.]
MSDFKGRTAAGEPGRITRQIGRKVWLWFNLVLASTAVFWVTDWDVRLERLFYHHAHGDWLLDHYPLWKSLLYDSVPVITATVVFGTLTLILAGFRFVRVRRWRVPLLYLLLVFVLGPGLLVNATFKDHWGRPRPIQLQVFGGQAAYVPPLAYVPHSPGRSFPSGHASVGFAFVALWFIWRRRLPQWAGRALMAALLLGSLIGLTRMAAGGHFLSDVIWAGWMCLFAAWLLSPMLDRGTGDSAGNPR